MSELVRSEYLMWGERGLISTFLGDLCTVESFERWEVFLNRLSPPIPGRVSRVWCVIEPDFGRRGFGSPDAAIYLEVDHQPLVLLLEAKRDSFCNSAGLQSDRQSPGFNSRINGQIELNYRLALALEDFSAEHDRVLVEPSWLLTTPYAETDAQMLRRVKNPAVLALASERLISLSDGAYHHVVVTSDYRNPLLELGDNDAVRPRLYGKDGLERWQEIGTRIHWISWAQCCPLAESWESSSLFLRSLELNRSNLPPSMAPREAMAVVGHRGSVRGFSMIKLGDDFARKFPGFPLPANTYVHFSWRGDSCCLRSYSSIGQPLEWHGQTSAVEKFICDEEFPVERHEPVTNCDWWHAQTQRLNCR